MNSQAQLSPISEYRHITQKATLDFVRVARGLSDLKFFRRNVKEEINEYGDFNIYLGESLIKKIGKVLKWTWNYILPLAALIVAIIALFKK